MPLYYQLAGLLREKITSGQFPPGSKIPTEAALVSEYDLSRITVRQALANLEDEGLIRRDPGRGTFVTERRSKPNNKQDELVVSGSLADLISMGQATSVKLLDLEVVSASPDAASVLEVSTGDRLTRVTRLRFHQGQPYSYIENLLPPFVGKKLTRAYLRKGSVLRFIEQELGIKLRDAEQRVRASLADAALAQLLETPIGSPLLYVDRSVRAADGRVVERVRTFYRADLFSLDLHLTRDARRHRTGWSFKDRKLAG